MPSLSNTAKAYRRRRCGRRWFATDKRARDKASETQVVIKLSKCNYNRNLFISFSTMYTIEASPPLSALPTSATAYRCLLSSSPLLCTSLVVSPCSLPSQSKRWTMKVPVAPANGSPPSQSPVSRRAIVQPSSSSSPIYGGGGARRRGGRGREAMG